MDGVPLVKDVLVIDGNLCIDCGFCRESCPWVAVVQALTIQHHYEILADRCHYCGGVGKAPCEVYCPVPKAIVGAKYDAGAGRIVESQATDWAENA